MMSGAPSSSNTSSSKNNNGRGRGGGGRGGRGGNSGARGGRGGGGGRGARGNEASNASSGTEKSNNKQDRKQGKRAKQVAAMEKKGHEEDSYFRKCQKEAISYNANHNMLAGTAPGAKNQQELFGTQGSQGINFKNYDAIKVEVTHPTLPQAADVIMKSFGDLKLTPQLARNIALMNYTHPTPIQRHAIPLGLNGEDLMCCAQTGSGKTCAFLLPIVAALTSPSPMDMDTSNDDNGSNTKGRLQPAKPLCVVLAPTRELASQIELEAQKLTHMLSTVQPVCVYGGASARSQLRDLAWASSSNLSLIVVATPGRLTDFVDRAIVSLSSVKYLCLDEVRIL